MSQNTLSDRFRKKQEGRPAPSQHKSDPEDEAPKGNLQYSDRQAPQPNKYGPGFQQGPRQEEIFDKRTSGERVSKEDLHGRHHSVQFDRLEENKPKEYGSNMTPKQPVIPKHQLSDPYEKIPPVYTTQMKSEYNRYKDLSDKPKWGDIRRSADIGMRVPVRGDEAPTNEQGRFIKDREADARGGRIAANTAAQARSGFNHKYPQAYEDKAAINTHHTQVHAKLTQADNYRKSEQDLDKRHHAWAQKMDRHGVPMDEDQQSHRPRGQDGDLVEPVFKESESKQWRRQQNKAEKEACKQEAARRRR